MGSGEPADESGEMAAVRGIRPGGRRRRRDGGRHRMVGVRLSDTEYDELAARAESAGVSLPRLLVEAAMGSPQVTPAERRAWLATLLAARQGLAGAANNLNQLTHLGQREKRVPAGVTEAADAVADAASQLEVVLEDFRQ